MMKLPTWDFKTSRIQIGGRQLETKEVILAGAMGAVIIAALVLAVLTFVRGESGTYKGPTTPVVFHYQCTACSKEFTLDKLPEVAPGVIADATTPVDCQLCKAKKKAYLENECPLCHQYYLPPAQSADPSKRTSLICPKCKGDIGKWYIDNKK
jgi:hypothetical protein